MKLVIFPAVDEARLADIQAVASDLEIVNAAAREAARQAIVDADAFMGNMDPELLRTATRLRWIQAPRIGLEHYVFPELVRHPAILTNMRGTFSDLIADHVLGFMLSFTHGLHRYRDAQRQRTWAPARPCLYPPDLTLGIIGLGGIGREVARRGHFLGMQVIAIDPRTDEKEEVVKELRGPEALDWLLGESDFVVVSAPHTPETEKMLRRPQLQRMKPTAFLINIGRGVIADLQDLTDALQAGEIAGAGLDVFEIEPLPPDHPLWAMPDVIITPHAAGHVRDIVSQRQRQLFLDNLRRFLNDEPLRNVVQKDQWF